MRLDLLACRDLAAGTALSSAGPAGGESHWLRIRAQTDSQIDLLISRFEHAARDSSEPSNLDIESLRLTATITTRAAFTYAAGRKLHSGRLNANVSLDERADATAFEKLCTGQLSRSDQDYSQRPR